MAIIIFGPLVVAVVLTGVVFYRLFFKSMLDPAYKEKEREDQAKEKGWALPLFITMMIVVFLYRIRIISVELFAFVMLPVLLATLYILIFKHWQEQNGITFLDIFKNPKRNIGMFLLLCFLIVICGLFMGLHAITSL